MTVEVHDCWNRIGVRGDASCPELAAHVHCRNCPTYSSAAAALLARYTPPRQMDETTGEVARPVEDTSQGSATAIVFRLGAEWFALSPLAFDEVVEPRAIRALPHRRVGAVLGLVSVRGELVVCVSLSHVMGLATGSEPPTRGRLVVVNHPEGRMAFPVDEVRSIHAYHEHELKELPATVARSASNFADALLPWSGRMVGRLDGARLANALNRSVA